MKTGSKIQSAKGRRYFQLAYPFGRTEKICDILLKLDNCRHLARKWDKMRDLAVAS
jgi:hypothetical protein